MDGLMFTVGVVALASVLIGLARLGAWVIDRREEQASKVIRDAAFVANARSEIPPAIARFQELEIEATKRGDLLAAANFAEQAEGIADVR